MSPAWLPMQQLGLPAWLTLLEDNVFLSLHILQHCMHTALLTHLIFPYTKGALLHSPALSPIPITPRSSCSSHLQGLKNPSQAYFCQPNGRSAWCLMWQLWSSMLLQLCPVDSCFPHRQRRNQILHDLSTLNLHQQTNTSQYTCKELKAALFTT